MLDNNKNMFKCNSCHISRCSKTTFKMYEKIGDSTNCLLYTRPIEFKVPLLVHVLSSGRNAQPIFDILMKFGYIIQELEKYPYFILKRRINA